MVVTPSRQNLVQPTGIEPVYLPFQGSTHPSKSKLHIINCHHGNRKSTPYRLEVKNPWLRHHLVLARHYLAGQSQNRDDDKIWSAWRILKSRPLAPKTSALPLSYTLLNIYGRYVLCNTSYTIYQNSCIPTSIIWQDYKDSNLRYVSQSHMCYRYTIVLFTVLIWYSGRDSNPQGSFLL